MVYDWLMQRICGYLKRQLTQRAHTASVSDSTRWPHAVWFQTSMDGGGLLRIYGAGYGYTRTMLWETAWWVGNWQLVPDIYTVTGFCIRCSYIHPDVTKAETSTPHERRHTATTLQMITKKVSLRNKPSAARRSKEPTWRPWHSEAQT